MNSRIIQLLISLLLITLSVILVFVIVFKRGNIDHREFWHIMLGIFLVLLLAMNLRPFWSAEKKHRQFFEDFLSRTDSSLHRRILGPGLPESLDKAYRPFAKLIGIELFGVTEGNDVEIITEGARKYELLMRDLENAKESIHIQYFHFGADKGARDVRDMLIKKAQEGVQVRFINENIGNLPIIHRYYRSMKKGGVEVIRFTGIKEFLSTLNYRNHRKIVVIDGRVGYTGGMNINDHYFRKWRDTHLRIEGDAVAQLQLIFLNSWVTSGGKVPDDYMHLFPEFERTPGEKIVQVIADEPGLRFHPIEASYQWALMNAKDYFYIQTPYFVPTEPVMDALKGAARSGVDVRLMLPRKSDTAFMGPANKSFYKDCLLSGIRIFERSGEFMHSKTFVSDDYLSSIGSANMDVRSFRVDFEDNAYLYDRELAVRNKEIFLDDLPICTEITLDDVKSWPWYQVFLQKVIRLFAPLL